MDATEIALTTRQDWLRLHRGRAEAAEDIWAAVRERDPALLRRAIKEAQEHPTAAAVDVIASAEAFHQAANESRSRSQRSSDPLDVIVSIADRTIPDQLLEELTSDVEISDEEIQEYYDANEAQFTEEASVRASHILFNVDDKATAETVLAEIQAGGDFASLAKEYSQDTASAEDGGDLGWPTTPYVPEFQAAADELEVGQTSALVETTFGWHIIRVTEVRGQRVKPIEEVSEQIEQILIQQHNADVYQEFLDELRADAEIVILIPELAVPIDDETTGTAGDSE